MKKIAFFFLLLFILYVWSMATSCAPKRYCQPSKGSSDYAYVTFVHREELVTYVKARHYRQEWHIYFKCLPDSVRVGEKVNITGWEKI